MKGYRKCRGWLAAAIVATGAVIAAPAAAQNTDYLTIGAGAFDVNDDFKTGQGTVEYRGTPLLWRFKPMGGLMINGDGGGFLYGGVLLDVPLGAGFVVTPSFAPGYYWEGDGKDLGFPLEFRSGLEIAYQMKDTSRVGIAVHHLSNASLDADNPGTETVTFFYSLPFGQIVDWAWK